MTRVVVVHRQPDVAAEQAAVLRGAGYQVEVCGGPTNYPCPVVHDLPCPLADGADVLVYEAWAAGGSEAGRQLVAHVRDLYADLPLVLTDVDASLSWIETEGPERVRPLVGRPDPEALLAAVGMALADQGMAV
ncbi:MAG: hypothetical protein M0Z49_01150 [Chloroflexi bacterium]|nr:hypothetical protein [Chloroflexota bacterium]